MTEPDVTPMLDRLEGRLVVASNRLPIVLSRTEEEGWSVEPGSGGLVTALAPVLRRTGGVWVGWPGTVEAGEEALVAPLERASERAGYRLLPIPLRPEERDAYYYGFSNEVLWPLLHSLQTRYRFDPDYWNAYLEINRRFAGTLAELARPGDYLWVQDYHLMGVAHELRRLGVGSRVGYFLHTPFPPLDILLKLPWREPLLNRLLQYDLLGFQTLRDRRNFLEAARSLAPGVEVRGSGSVVECRAGDRTLRIGAFPISIDFEEFVTTAAGEPVRERRREIRHNLPDRELLLGVDRLDYTKGIPNRLEAFEHALERFPELQRRVSLVQVVVPSRERITEYGRLRREIERLVGRINGRFGTGGWVPVHYLYRSLDRPELIAYYRSASVAVVTPLADGMNLVAKEYCACNLDEDGVLILSEFAGAAAQLQDGALLVNPHDIVSTALAILRAVEMDREERCERMRTLREQVRRQDIFRWLENSLRGAFAEDPDAVPPLRDYLPGAPPPTSATEDARA